MKTFVFICLSFFSKFVCVLPLLSRWRRKVAKNRRPECYLVFVSRDSVYMTEIDYELLPDLPTQKRTTKDKIALFYEFFVSFSMVFLKQIQHSFYVHVRYDHLSAFNLTNSEYLFCIFFVFVRFSHNFFVWKIVLKCISAKHKNSILIKFIDFNIQSGFDGKNTRYRMQYIYSSLDKFW